MNAFFVLSLLFVVSNGQDLDLNRGQQLGLKKLDNRGDAGPFNLRQGSVDLLRDSRNLAKKVAEAANHGIPLQGAAGQGQFQQPQGFQEQQPQGNAAFQQPNLQKPPQAQAPNPVPGRQFSKVGAPIKIAEHPDCKDDVKAMCSESSTANNFAVIDCLQNDIKVS